MQWMPSLVDYREPLPHHHFYHMTIQYNITVTGKQEKKAAQVSEYFSFNYGQIEDEKQMYEKLCLLLITSVMVSVVCDSLLIWTPLYSGWGEMALDRRMNCLHC